MMALNWLCIASIGLQLLGSVYGQPGEKPGATVSHTDIRDAILTLVSATRDHTSKLERHELRERQLGDALTRQLASLDSRSRGQEKNLDNLAILMARMDDRLRKMEEMIIQRDERERIQLQKLMDNAVAIRAIVEGKTSASGSVVSASAGPANESEMVKQLHRIRKKTEAIEEIIQSRLSVVANEVKIVGEKFESRSERIESLQLATMENLGKSQSNDAEKLRAASVNLVATETKWRQFLNDAQSIVNQFGTGIKSIADQASRSRNDTSAILVGIENLETAMENLQKSAGSGGGVSAVQVAAVNESLSVITTTLNLMEKSILTDLKSSMSDILNQGQVVHEAQGKLAESVQQNFEAASLQLEQSVANITDSMATRFGVFEVKMNESQTLIQHQVEESGNMAETLADRVDKSYGSLAKEINGLHKVEQVLLETADGVLDTKRRLEFAVQQILLELGDSIRRQTGDLNSTLARKVDDVTFSVIANQSQTLTNMTSKLENELGQVWRQIGVLYQSASQSQELLQRVEQQTAQHVGGSLQALSSMDKRVGQVTERVNEVDDHLNYLLGRLSLVVQEFNQVRGGLGEALESLRSGLAVTQGQNEKQKSPPYDVSDGKDDADVSVITRKESPNDIETEQ